MLEERYRSCYLITDIDSWQFVLELDVISLDSLVCVSNKATHL
jgi:hypothetical protein